MCISDQCDIYPSTMSTAGAVSGFLPGGGRDVFTSEGGENLSGGGEKIARYPLSLGVFCFSTQHC